MIILGLTGSIGMGKSTTSKMFRQQGIEVYDADASVHQLYMAGPAVSAIEASFPGTTDQNGVDRKKLSDAIFGSPKNLEKLEKIVHPMVRQTERAFLEKNRAQGAKLVVLDIPLLLETGGDKRVDKILIVTAPYEVQKDRVLAREGMSLERFEQILKKQMPDAEKRKRADYLIDTSMGLAQARKSVSKIIDELTVKHS